MAGILHNKGRYAVLIAVLCPQKFAFAFDDDDAAAAAAADIGYYQIGMDFTTADK